MNTKFIKWSMCIGLLTSISYAQEQDSLKINQLNEVVVSDTKFAQSKEKSGKIIETSVESIVPLMNGKMNLSYILFDYGIGY